MVPHIVDAQQPRLQVKPVIELRERFESRQDKDFDSAKPDRRTDGFSRWRLGVGLAYGKHWSAMLSYQYSHDLAGTPARNFSTEGRDVIQGWLRYKGEKFQVTLGRQPIEVGAGRLIATTNWGNKGRAYDGVAAEGTNWMAFAAKVGVSGTSVPDLRVGGLSYVHKYGRSSAIYKHDETAAGDVDLITLDHAVSLTQKDLTFDLEGALQFGHSQGLEHRAWAAHAQVSYRKKGSPTRFYVEVNAAGGGSNGSTVFTFDQLLASNHAFYGIMDLQGWRNMNEIAIGADHKLDKRTEIKASWHAFSLRDAADAWYGDNGNPNRWSGGAFIDPTGLSGRDVGQEFDLEISHTPTKTTTLTAGIGFFAPGSFVKSITSSSTRQVFGFIQAVFKF